CYRHRVEVDVAHLIGDVGDQFTVGRNGRSEFVARRVGEANRLSAFGADPVEFEVAGAVNDVGAVDEARAVRDRREALQVDDIFGAIFRQGHLHHDGNATGGHRPDLRLAAAFGGKVNLVRLWIPRGIDPFGAFAEIDGQRLNGTLRA